MQRESPRDVARRLIANYRLRRRGSPARLVPEPTPQPDARFAEAFGEGAALAGSAPQPSSASDQIVEELANDAALLFDVTLTERDARFLASMHIDPDY